MTATLSVRGFLGLQGFTYTVIPTIMVLRVWILRHRPRTIPSTLQHVFFSAYGVFILLNGVFITKFSVEELRLQPKYPDEKELFLHMNTVGLSKDFFVMTLLYTIELWFLKIAFLGYFYALWTHLSRGLRICVIVISFYVAATFLTAILMMLTYCLPISRNWALDATRCAPLELVPGVVVQAWANISSDLTILLLPVTTISSLKLRNAEKWALVVVTAIGSISPIMAVNRFVVVYQTAREPSSTGIEVIRANLVWGTLENTFAYMAFFLPALRVYFRRLQDGTQASRSKMSVQPSKPFAIRSSGGEDTKVQGDIEVQYMNQEATNSQIRLTTWEASWDEGRERAPVG